MNPSMLQLVYTREWVPRIEALDASRFVYRDFASNPDCLEDLVVLSASLRSTDAETAIRSNLSEEILIRLTRRDYFIKDAIGSFASRITIRSKVAVNMVVPDIDGDNIAGYLSEPFVAREIFPALHKAHRKEFSERRNKAGQDFI